MTTQELMSLAERCEAATGPDRELDAMIAVAIYSDTGHADQRDNTHARFPSRSDQCAPGTYWISAFSGLSLRTAESYSASLDAALTLVPGKWAITAASTTDLWQAWVWQEDVAPNWHEAATPALALTAAALRSRADTGGRG